LNILHASRSVDTASRQVVDKTFETQLYLRIGGSEVKKFLEYSSDGTQVRCKICQSEAKSGVGRWILTKNLKSHLERNTHKACMGNYTAREHDRREELEQLSAAYNAPSTSENPYISPFTPAHLPTMFPESDPDGDSLMDTLGSASELMHELGQTVDAGVVTQEESHALLQQQFERMLQDAYQEAEFEAGVGDEFIADEMPKEIDDDEEEEDNCFDLSLLDNSAYHPYPNKTVMLLDIMDNLPRCRFTSAQMALVIHFAKQIGAPDVPSLKGLRKIQQSLQSSCGNKPVKSKSYAGNVFYMNDIRETLARDMANPLVAPHMHFYPEETDGPISETYQAERWKEYEASQLTPMFSKGFKRFWIEELAQLADGRYVIPHTWIVRNGVLTSDVTIVTRTSEGRWSHDASREETIKAEQLELDYTDLIAEFGEVFHWVNNSQVPPMPNKMRELVDDDEDLFVIMVSPWADDVSGNRSKQYNKHMNMYTSNGCLPGRLLQQEFHVHYVSSSPHASSAEQFSTFRDHVKSTETRPVKAYNAATKRNCRFILRTPGLPADNPQQSEEASHMGSNANFPCRKCHWGGTKIEKEADGMYHECHFAGVARNAEEIRENLQKQLQLAVLGEPKPIEEFQRATGTKDKITQYWIDILLAKAKELRAADPRRQPNEIADELRAWLEEQPGDKMNPLLDIIGLDPSQDTPVELLHTILLGVMKYIWHHMNTQWSDTDRHLLAIRLQSTDLSGLTVPPLRAGYLIQYKNNLIGKHFKTMMQALAFHVHGMSNPNEFALIKAAGDLGARLWVPEIGDMDTYLEQLKIAIANLLDAFDAVDPLRILVKIKLHLLAHIPDDVRRFGPLIRFATEIYEAYNAVFRLCSVFSNRLAPSRDISLKFASMDRVKHFLSGGYWWNPSLRCWVQAGSAVCRILVEDPVFQRLLGWVPPSKVQPGLIKPAAKKKPELQWRQTKASIYWNSGLSPPPESMWREGYNLTTQTGDKVMVDSWVVALDSTGKSVLGRISELLIGDKSLVTLEQFMRTRERHPDYDWPVLRRPTGPEIVADAVQSFLVLDSSSIQFVFSVQHDCRKGNCQPTIIQKEFQEREETDRNVSLIQHSDDDHFIINMAGLHNFVKLCRTLGPSLTDLKPLHPDRVAFHKKASAKAQETRSKGRKKTAEKRRAAAAAKKHDAEVAAAAAIEAETAAIQAEQAEAEGRDVDDTEDEGAEPEVYESQNE
ncbi:hypothetical protein DFH07DRAFT_994762, partial [Mycena maculata]